MNKDNSTEMLIEALLQSNNWYIISPFHCIYGAESDFSELEDYLIKNYIHTFSDKVSMIVLKMICLYPAYIELTEFYPEYPPAPLHLVEYTNIRDIGLENIAKMIEYIVIQGGTSMNIYFADFNSLIQISSGFDLVVYSSNQEFLKNLQTLVNMEGLYMDFRSEL